MNVLHLSETPLSGSPDRIVKVLNAYSDICARHLVWNTKARSRSHPTDINSSELSYDEVVDWLEWADTIHYHNRYERQSIFQEYDLKPPKVPSVIQIHSPRDSEDFSEEINSGIPLAIVGQYQPRQWEKELSFIVPNVVDINSKDMMPVKREKGPMPFVTFAPSSTNGHGWDDKGYSWISPIMKRWKLSGRIKYKLIHAVPWEQAMAIKQTCDIGIDDLNTGSYHLSALEYLSMGIATYCYTDEKTEAVVKDLTGADSLPWLSKGRSSFEESIIKIMASGKYKSIGEESRAWMEKYWSPDLLVEKYIDMYMQL